MYIVCLTYLMMSQIHPSTTLHSLEEKENRHEKQKDCVTDCYPHIPYVASYEEDAPNLVNNLVPEPTPKEKRYTNKTEESKTTEDRTNLIEITDKEDNLDSDWDMEYSY